TREPLPAGSPRVADSRSASEGMAAAVWGAPEAIVLSAKRGSPPDPLATSRLVRVAYPSPVGSSTGVPSPLKNVLPPAVEAGAEKLPVPVSLLPGMGGA